MINFFTNSALWNWTSPVWLAVAALVGVYCWMNCRSRSRETSGMTAATARTLTSSATWLVAAIVIWLFAFISPIGVLADGYLFSAHMVQHLLLLLVVPLFFMLSLPWGQAASPVPDNASTRHRMAARACAILSIPMFGWICGIGAMWFWHVPSICTAATESYALSIVRSASFLLAGLAFWWPVYAPIERSRLRPLNAVVYLFSACLGCTLLGIYITFTTISVCPAFANPADRVGILTSLYQAGLTPAADQQLGGLLMWVPPCSLYVCAIISVLCRWYAEEDATWNREVTPALKGIARL